MIFSTRAIQLLTKMKINAARYSSDLESEFSDDAQIFNSIIENFDEKDKINGNKEFVSFVESCGYYDHDSKLVNYAYELYNNLDRFFSGGVLNLFKRKQVEWGAPEVKISKNDVPRSDINKLDAKVIIYRGLRLSEHSSVRYGQSWTLDFSTAKRFAEAVYSDQPLGIVVKTVIPKKNIVYYDKHDEEYEVIVEYGSVRNSDVVQD